MISKGYLTNITTILLLVCTGFLSSCKKEEVAISKNYPVEVNVTETTDTKISTNGTKLYWQGGDQLSLFAASAGNSSTGSATLQLNSIDAGSATGKFKGEISLSAEPNMCYFTHPSSCTPSYADSKVSAVFDYSSQDGTHKPFLWGKAAYPTGGGVLNCTLSHVGGMVALSNIPSGVTSITIKGNSAEQLSPITINMADGSATIGSNTEFTFNISGTSAYICMPPVNFSKGFSIIYNSSSGSMYKSYSSNGTADSGYDFTAGTYVTINAGGDFTPLEVASSATYTHTVADGYLTGTQVTATPNLQGAPVKITTWRAELIHPDGSTVVRTISPNNNFSASSMNVTDGWEYLPAGTYKYKFYYTLNQGTENVVTTDLIIVKATAPVKISLSGEIEHRYESNILTGSTARITATNNNDFPITSWSAILRNSDDKPVREISDNTSFDTEELFSGSGYLSSQKKYIPVGTTCKVKGDVLNCATTADSINAPVPAITVTPNFETSYTRYLAYLAYKAAGTGTSDDLANALANANTSGTGNQAMNISVSVNVSENLLSQYDNSLTFTYDGLSMLTNGTNISTSTLYANTLQNNTGLLTNSGTASATIVSQAHGQHTIAASFTFDGKTVTASKPCHITGIPYEKSLENNPDLTGWILHNDGSCYKRLTLKRGEAYAITPAFHVPDNINVKSSLVAYAYGGSAPSSYKPTVAIHASESGTNSNANATLQGKRSLPYTAEYSTIENNTIQITPSVKRICIYTSGEGSGWSVGDGDMGVVCESFSTIYR